MKLLSIIPLAVSCAIFLHTCTTNPTEAPPLVAATAIDPCYLEKGMTNATQQACIKVLCAHLALIGVSCHSDTPPQPPPTPSAMGGSSSVPVATGGSVATGGKAGTGGTSGLSPTAKCTAAKTKDAHVINVAAQTGQSVASLVATICADPTILGAYK